MQSLKKILTLDSKNKGSKFLGSNYINPFWGKESFFSEIGFCHFFSSNAKYAKTQKNPYGGSCKELFTDQI